MIFSELPARDAKDSKDFWHDEILLFVASQLRAVGIPLVPLAREEGKSDPDAFAPPNLFVEVKHRPASTPNAPRDLGSFTRKALRADQIRRRNSAAIGIVVIDLGSHDTVNEDDFLPVDEAIYAELRRSGLLHAVIVSGMKRNDPATWIFLSRGIQKRATLARGLCDRIVRAFPYGTLVGTTELSNFGVREDPPKM